MSHAVTTIGSDGSSFPRIDVPIELVVSAPVEIGLEVSGGAASLDEAGALAAGETCAGGAMTSDPGCALVDGGELLTAVATGSATMRMSPAIPIAYRILGRLRRIVAKTSARMAAIAPPSQTE